MKMVCLYGHYGSGNHGNEAIVRGLKYILGDDIPLHVYSMNIDVDKKFGLEEVCVIHDAKMALKRYSLTNVIGALQYKILKRNNVRYQEIFKELLNYPKEKVYVLEMGDQYCEDSSITTMYAWINKKIHKKNGKIIALGGSINPEQLNNKNILKDLSLYNLLIIRESLTYNLLRERGFRNIILCPDPAFAMQAKRCYVDNRFSKGKTIGVVIGGVAQGNETKSEELINGVERFIKYLMERTNYNVALIPHVRVGGGAR